MLRILLALYQSLTWQKKLYYAVVFVISIYLIFWLASFLFSLFIVLFLISFVLNVANNFMQKKPKSKVGGVNEDGMIELNKRQKK